MYIVELLFCIWIGLKLNILINLSIYNNNRYIYQFMYIGQKLYFLYFFIII